MKTTKKCDIEFQYIFDNCKAMAGDTDKDWMSGDMKKRANTVGLSMFADKPSDIRRQIRKILAEEGKAKAAVDMDNGSDKEKSKELLYRYSEKMSEIAYLGGLTWYDGDPNKITGPIFVDLESSYYKDASENRFNYSDKKMKASPKGMKAAAMIMGIVYDDLSKTVKAASPDPTRENLDFFFGEDHSSIDSIYGKMAMIIACAEAIDRADGTGYAKRYRDLSDSYCADAGMPPLEVGNEFLDRFFSFITDENDPSKFRYDPHKTIDALEKGKIGFYDAVTSIEIIITPDASSGQNRLDYLKEAADYWRKK